jgi:hypothetical protein
MQSVVDKVALKRLFSESFGLPVSIIPPVLYKHFIITVVVVVVVVVAAVVVIIITIIITNCKCSTGKHFEILGNLKNFVAPGTWDLCTPPHAHIHP